MEQLYACLDDQLKEELRPKIQRLDKLGGLLRGDTVLSRSKYNKLGYEEDKLKQEVVRIVNAKAPYKYTFSDFSTNFSGEDRDMAVAALLENMCAFEDLSSPADSEPLPEELELVINKKDMPKVFARYNGTIQQVGIERIAQWAADGRKDIPRVVFAKVLKKELEIMKRAVQGGCHFFSMNYGDPV